MTVNPTARFDPATGVATVSGTITCTGEAVFTFIDVELRQRVGRFIISGFGSTDFPCDGTTHPWSIEVAAQNGLFKGGRAAARTFAVACDALDQCGESFQEVTVQLKGG
jgi:hypothetical protein